MVPSPEIGPVSPCRRPGGDPILAANTRRVLTPVGLSYEDLIRRGEVKAGDKLPMILPVVIYNGRAPWRAATDISELIAPVPAPLRRYLPRAGHVVFDLQRIGEWDGTPKNLATSLGRVERAPSADNVRRFMRNQADRFPGPGFAELRKALLTWVAGAGEAWQISRKELARIRSLTEDETMWERVKEMREQIHREGLELGLERGRAEGRERGLEQGLERGRADGRPRPSVIPSALPARPDVALRHSAEEATYVLESLKLLFRQAVGIEMHHVVADVADCGQLLDEGLSI